MDQKKKITCNVALRDENAILTTSLSFRREKKKKDTSFRNIILSLTQPSIEEENRKRAHVPRRFTPIFLEFFQRECTEG